MLILMRGAGDLASGVALRLHRAGMKVIMTEIAQPMVIRRTIAFAQAVYDGTAMVEDVKGVLVQSPAEALQTLDAGEIPIIIDPEAAILHELQFDAMIDGILAKRNIGTKITDAPIVIGLGPGFTAGVDCHAVIETMRGHYLGRVILQGSAEPDTATPGMVGGYSIERIVRAPAEGIFQSINKIGDIVEADQTVAEIITDDGRHVPVKANIPGVLRGLLYDGLRCPVNMKIGDVDPRPVYEHCFTVTDKASAIGGGCLEAILRFTVAKNPDFYAK